MRRPKRVTDILQPTLPIFRWWLYVRLFAWYSTNGPKTKIPIDNILPNTYDISLTILKGNSALFSSFHLFSLQFTLTTKLSSTLIPINGSKSQFCITYSCCSLESLSRKTACLRFCMLEITAQAFFQRSASVSVEEPIKCHRMVRKRMDWKRCGKMVAWKWVRVSRLRKSNVLLV